MSQALNWKSVKKDEIKELQDKKLPIRINDWDTVRGARVVYVHPFGFMNIVMMQTPGYHEIKEFIAIGEDEVDFMLCEIGGTVGDIEGLPFFEAIRQFSQDKPHGQCIFMHLTLLPFIKASGELKTKPTQHSVKELRSIGIAPDILVCRSEGSIPKKEREKLALFCNVRPDSVITAQDLKSIYEAGDV